MARKQSYSIIPRCYHLQIRISIIYQGIRQGDDIPFHRIIRIRNKTQESLLDALVEREDARDVILVRQCAEIGLEHRERAVFMHDALLPPQYRYGKDIKDVAQQRGGSRSSCTSTVSYIDRGLGGIIYPPVCHIDGSDYPARYYGCCRRTAASGVACGIREGNRGARVICSAIIDGDAADSAVVDIIFLLWDGVQSVPAGDGQKTPDTMRIKSNPGAGFIDEIYECAIRKIGSIRVVYQSPYIVKIIL